MKMNENIRNLRLKMKLSQEKLGEILGVSAQAVSKWEQGITSPDISLLPVIAECFGVTIDSLFQGIPARKYPGYVDKRDELLAFYSSENGTDEDFQKAEQAYSVLILSGKATSYDYLNYGILHRMRAHRDIGIAIHYYKKAIDQGQGKKDEPSMTAHQTLTNLLFDLGRVDEAIQEQKNWRDKEPNNAWARVSYSYALERAERLEEAWSEIEIALKLDPTDQFVLTAAGDLSAKLGNYNDAISYWDRIPLDTDCISHLFSKAEMYASMGEKENAIKQFEQILDWLGEHGYNMEIEGAHSRQRIEEIRNQ